MTIHDPSHVEHLNASAQVIGVNVEAFYAGALQAYRPIAAELRKLLCDFHRGSNISLLPRCFPGVHFHVLIGSPEMIDDITTLYIPALTRFDGKGGSDIVRLFNEQGPMLPLDQWLEQRLFSKDISIRELIRSVADKEGAHADLELNKTLLLTKAVKYPQGESLAAKTIVAIARYVINGAAIRILVATGESPRILAAARARGRGVMALTLRDFCRFGVGRFHPTFLTLEEAIREIGNWSDGTQLSDLVESYDPDSMFMLMTRDLNGRGRDVYGIRV